MTAGKKEETLKSCLEKISKPNQTPKIRRKTFKYLVENIDVLAEEYFEQQRKITFFSLFSSEPTPTIIDDWIDSPNFLPQDYHIFLWLLFAIQFSRFV